MEIPGWDSYFMTMVYLVASRSKDEGAHVGAVVVDSKNRLISTGYNGFPRGIDDNVPERQEKPIKYDYFEHAERNAVYNAKSSLENCKMYTNGIPCAPCARAVIQAGIIEVIADKEWDKNPPLKWKESKKASLEMFEEAGIKVRHFDGFFVQPVRFYSHKPHPLEFEEKSKDL